MRKRKKKLAGYKRRRKRRTSNSQMVFTETGTMKPKPRVTTQFEQDIKPVSCPFCLYTSSIREFLIQLKKGYSEKRFECPDCGQRMMGKTLKTPMSPSEYGAYLYVNVILERGYDRISWTKLTSRLKQMGIANEFWTAWRKAKEGWRAEKPKTFEEAMEEQAQEYYKELKPQRGRKENE